MSNPGNCAHGITLSVWALILDAPRHSNPDYSVTLISSGAPEYTGLVIYLTKSRNNVEGRITATWIIDIGNAYWKANLDMNISEVLGSWHNWALSWTKNEGEFGIIDGRIIGMTIFLI